MYSTSRVENGTYLEGKDHIFLRTTCFYLNVYNLW